jgi:serine/threonine protein phosphatase PrpC
VALFAKRFLPLFLRGSAYYKAKNYKEALIEAFLKVDEMLRSPEGSDKIKEIVAANPPNPYLGWDESMSAQNVGCTACVLLLTPTEIFIANAGDSRCVMRQGTETVPLSFDHKPNLESEAERIRKAGGFVANGRVDGDLSCSRALGDLALKANATLKPEEQKVSPMPDVRITPRTADIFFIVLACDGIWECLSSEKVVEEITQSLGTEATYLKPSFRISNIISGLFDKIVAPDANVESTCLFHYQ